MAAQISKVELGGLLRKNATTKVEMPQDFTRLPGGIDDGVAQLCVATLGEYKTGVNQGDKYIRLAATVVQPITAIDVKRIWDKEAINPRNRTKKGAVVVVGQRERRVAGLQTSVMLPLCPSGWNDQKKEFETSVEDNIKAAFTALNLAAGCDDKTPDDQLFTAPIAQANDGIEALTELLKQLEAAAPFIKFTTSDLPPSEKYPEPKVFERWYGSKGLENYTPPVAGEHVNKTVNGMTAANGNGQASHGQVNQAAAVANAMTEMAKGGADADGALTELLTLATNGVPDAQEQLLNLAVSLGVPQNVLEAVPDNDWNTVYGLILEHQAPATPTLPQETGAAKPAPVATQAAPSGPDPSHPEVGDKFFYKITKNMKTGIAVEVTAVLQGGGVKAKNISNPRMEYTIDAGRLDLKA